MRILIILFLLGAGGAKANDWDALSQPGAIAIMRHALAPGTGDPPTMQIGDCATQRNLDARGRDQARAIGAEFRARGITFDTVFTSQWCRTRETADLLSLGPVIDAPSLNSFFQNRATRDAQTAATRDLIADTAGRVMLVTHQVNISALTNQGTRSGEILIIRMRDGQTEVLGSIMLPP